MLYHTCGSYILMDLKNAYRILSGIGITDTGLTVGACEISNTSADVTPNFLCPECGKNVPASEIYVSCGECGVKLTVEEAFKIKGSGGLFCKQHAEAFSSSESKKIISFSKIIGILKLK